MMCGHHARHPSPHRSAAVVTVPADQRVGDRDRDRTIEQLRLHVRHGRLSLEEFEERVGETLAARTGSELTGVLRELPRAYSEAEVSQAQAEVLRPYLWVNALLIVIWALTGFGFPWPIFPLLFWGMSVRAERANLERKLHPVDV